MHRVIVSVVAMAALASCASPAPPQPAEMATTAPPWAAPRDAITHIEAAGLPQVRLDATDHQHILDMRITVDGERVTIPAFIGVDRVRAVQAPVHTHDESGQVWLEGEGTGRVTLGGFFTVWGVRFSEDCLGHVCGRILVTADGRSVGEPASLKLVDVTDVRIEATSGE